jgi:4-alpha-glucanotransferase
VDDAARGQGLDEDLARLAGAYGVATEYHDWQGRHVVVPRDTVVAVLAALEVDASTPEALQQALRDVELAPWRRPVPTCTVVREGRAGRVLVHVRDGWSAQLVAVLEGGGRRPLRQVPHEATPRDVDGRRLGEAAFELPDDLPLGWHTLHLTSSPAEAGGAGEPPEEAEGTLVVSPQRLELPAALAGRRQWGFMTMLFQVRSEASWAFGDLADLTEVATWSAREHGAGFVLLNPLHATDPVPPLEASPYLPASRRFVNPLYLRVEDVRETAYLSAADRAVVEWHAEELRELNRDDVLIDRDLVWEAKSAALERVFRVRRSPAREASFRAFKEREGQGLVDWATWCALREFYGEPSPRWPEHAGRPDSEAVEQLREELAERVELHCWLQWLMDEQLAAAQRAALEAGMGLGIVHDLAVGVHPDGADAWALQDAMARGVSVGAPPDAFNQQGQDWSQPPWRPDALAASAYAPLRDMLRAVLRHGGGIRIDHIIGLFRLWWIPAGAGPDQGTYVRFDHEAMIGVLALEAHRAGAVVIGEDLGNVEPWVREYLTERGILGTSILWFEKDYSDNTPLRPQRWRELCLATVTTHDLPPTAGYLAGEHIEVRERLGLLTRAADEERAADAADRAAYLALLDELGLLPDDPLERQTVEALHRLLTWTPSLMLGVALPDAVGDRRAINQPGTHLEYPNWRLPMADGVGQPVLVEDLVRSPRAASLARVLHEGV